MNKTFLIGSFLGALLLPFATFAAIVGQQEDFGGIFTGRLVNDYSGVSFLPGDYATGFYCIQPNPLDVPVLSTLGAGYMRIFNDLGSGSEPTLTMQIKTYYSADCSGTATHTLNSENTPHSSDSGTQLMRFNFFQIGSTTYALGTGSYGVMVSLTTGGDASKHISTIMGGALSSASNTPWILLTDRTGTVITDFDIQGFYDSSSTVDLASCNPLTFNTLDCLYGLFGVPSEQLGTIVATTNTNLFYLFPFGYLTRFTAIVTGTATGTVPSLIIPFPDHIGSLDTSSLGSTTIDFQEAMNTGGSFLAGPTNDDGDTLWGVFMPFWQIFCYGMLIVAIIYDLLGLREIQHRLRHKKEVPV